MAARCVYALSDNAGFGLRAAGTYAGGDNMFYSGGRTGSNNDRLRPVVSLSSSILSDAKDASGAWNLK